MLAGTDFIFDFTSKCPQFNSDPVSRLNTVSIPKLVWDVTMLLNWSLLLVCLKQRAVSSQSTDNPEGQSTLGPLPTLGCTISTIQIWHVQWTLSITHNQAKSSVHRFKWGSKHLYLISTVFQKTAIYSQQSKKREKTMSVKIGPPGISLNRVNTCQIADNVSIFANYVVVWGVNK